MADIFVSYKREEKAHAKRLADALVRKGYSVWWDPHLRTGEAVDEEIERELENAKCIIVLWSKQSINSDYVKAEARYALELKKLMPAMVETVKLPFRFANIQTADLVGWDGSDGFAGFEKLLSDLTVRLTPGEGHKLESAFGKTFTDALKSLQEPVSLRTVQKWSSHVLDAPKLEPFAVGTLGGFKLKWTKVANANGYVLAMSDDNGFGDSQIAYEGQANDFGYFGGLVDPGFGHYYRVKAKGDSSNRDSDWSNSILVDVDTLKNWNVGSK